MAIDMEVSYNGYPKNAGWCIYVWCIAWKNAGLNGWFAGTPIEESSICIYNYIYIYIYTNEDNWGSSCLLIHKGDLHWLKRIRLLQSQLQAFISMQQSMQIIIHRGDLHGFTSVKKPNSYCTSLFSALTFVLSPFMGNLQGLRRHLCWIRFCVSSWDDSHTISCTCSDFRHAPEPVWLSFFQAPRRRQRLQCGL